jgi:hypothetical protein
VNQVHLAAPSGADEQEFEPLVAGKGLMQMDLDSDSQPSAEFR